MLNFYKVHSKNSDFTLEVLMDFLENKPKILLKISKEILVYPVMELLEIQLGMHFFPT